MTRGDGRSQLLQVTQFIEQGLAFDHLAVFYPEEGHAGVGPRRPPGGWHTLPLAGVDAARRNFDGHLVTLGNEVRDLDPMLAEKAATLGPRATSPSSPGSQASFNASGLRLSRISIARRTAALLSSTDMIQPSDYW